MITGDRVILFKVHPQHNKALKAMKGKSGEICMTAIHSNGPSALVQFDELPNGDDYWIPVKYLSQIPPKP